MIGNPLTRSPASKGQLVWQWSTQPSWNDFRGFVDETIRDGLQAPYAPNIDAAGKCRFLEAMGQAGVTEAIIGMATPAAHEELRAMVRQFKAIPRIPTPWVLTRAHRNDVERFLQLNDESPDGLALNVFLNVGRLRNHVEGWSLDAQLDRACGLISWARVRGIKLVRAGLEDATRAHPSDLRKTIGMLADAQVDRLAIADTAGVADEAATESLVRFCLREVAALRATQPVIEWHGHNDRGLAVANSLAAIKAGVHYVHATALGIGERNGNASLEGVLVNATLMGYAFDRWSALEAYVNLAKHYFSEWDVHMMPFYGDYSYCSGTGTHMAACSKALDQGREDLAKILFSPDSEINRRRSLECTVSPASGRRGVQLAFDQLSLIPNERVVDLALQMTQSLGRTLSKDELRQIANTN